LLPLAAIAIPQLGIGRLAVARAATIWVAMIAIGLAIAPMYPMIQLKIESERYLPGKPDATKRYLFNEPDVAAKATQLWRERYGVPLPVVAGQIFIAAAISFYSPDHPILFSQFDPRIATWIEPTTLGQSGFLAICPEADASPCESATLAISPAAERVVLTQQPNRFNPSASELRWNVYLIGPGEPRRGDPRAP
jgi:hypothetical protein